MCEVTNEAAHEYYISSFLISLQIEEVEIENERMKKELDMGKEEQRRKVSKSCTYVHKML